MNSITRLHNSPDILALLSEVDVAKFANELGGNGVTHRLPEAVSQLRVAAYVSLTELLGEAEVDSLLRQFAAESDALTVPRGVASAFENWVGYITALQELKEPPLIDDLLSFAAAGLLARRPIEVRSVLRQELGRHALDAAINGQERAEWADRVQLNISVALLLLVRQDNHEDVLSGGRVIRYLADDQRRVEGDWLLSQSNPRRNAMSLLGLYHMAEAVIRTSEFLLSGAIEEDGHFITDFAPQLRRLLVLAEEYLSLSGDMDILFWLNLATYHFGGG